MANWTVCDRQLFPTRSDDLLWKDNIFFENIFTSSINMLSTENESSLPRI